MRKVNVAKAMLADWHDRHKVDVSCVSAIAMEEWSELYVIDAESPCWTSVKTAYWNALMATAKQQQAEAPAQLAKAMRSDIETQGPKLWEQLHSYALTADLSDGGNAARSWLSAFTSRVPCGECKEHWKKLTNEHPADLTNNAAFFTWSVERHNDVNEKLQKKMVTVEEAKRLRACAVQEQVEKLQAELTALSV